MLLGEVAIGAADFLLRRVALHAQHLVGISLRHDRMDIGTSRASRAKASLRDRRGFGYARLRHWGVAARPRPGRASTCLAMILAIAAMAHGVLASSGHGETNGSTPPRPRRRATRGLDPGPRRLPRWKPSSSRWPPWPSPKSATARSCLSLALAAHYRKPWLIIAGDSPGHDRQSRGRRAARLVVRPAPHADRARRHGRRQHDRMALWVLARRHAEAASSRGQRSQRVSRHAGRPSSSPRSATRLRSRLWPWRRPIPTSFWWSPAPRPGC